MGKFSAAKIFDAMDQKLQKAMNYLIDLLETGYKVDSMINGNHVVLDINPALGFQLKTNNIVVGQITSDGYFAVSRIYDPDDPTTYVEIGDVVGESGRRAMAFYQATGANVTPRLRFRMKSYSTTAFTLEGVVKPAGTDVEGTVAFGVSHGNAAINLSDVTQLKTAQLYSGDAKFEAKAAEEITMKVGDLTFGVDTVGVFSSPDNGVTRTYSVTW